MNRLQESKGVLRGMVQAMRERITGIPRPIEVLHYSTDPTEKPLGGGNPSTTAVKVFAEAMTYLLSANEFSAQYYSERRPSQTAGRAEVHTHYGVRLIAKGKMEKVEIPGSLKRILGSTNSERETSVYVNFVRRHEGFRKVEPVEVVLLVADLRNGLRKIQERI